MRLKTRFKAMVVATLAIAATLLSTNLSAIASADTTPPSIDSSSLSPLDHGNTVFDFQPLMAKVTDEGSGINPDSISFTLAQGDTRRTYIGTWDSSTGWAATKPILLTSGQTYDATLEVADNAGNKQSRSWTFLTIAAPVVELAASSMSAQGINLNVPGDKPGTQKWSFDPSLTISDRWVHFRQGSKHAGWGTLSSSVPVDQAGVQIVLDGIAQDLPEHPFSAGTVKTVYQQIVYTSTSGAPRDVFVGSEDFRLPQITSDLPIGTTSATLSMDGVPTAAEPGGVCADPSTGTSGCSPDPLRFFMTQNMAERLDAANPPAPPAGASPTSSSSASAGPSGPSSLSSFCAVPGPDAGGYICDSTSYSWADTSGGTYLSGGGVGYMSDETVSGAVPLPFYFPWYGQTKTQVYVGSNGLLCFNNLRCESSSTSVSPPFAFPPNDDIQCFYTDLNPGTPGFGTFIRYKTVGTSPNRIFVVEFNRVIHAYPQSPPGNYFNTFQFQLAENGEARCMYSSVTNDNDGTPTAVGTEDSTGTNGVRYKWAEFAATNLGVRFTPGVIPGSPSVPALQFPTAGYTFGQTEAQKFIIRSTDPNGDPYFGKVTVRDSGGAVVATLNTAVAASGADSTGVLATSLPSGGYTWSAKAIDVKDTPSTESGRQGFGKIGLPSPPPVTIIGIQQLDPISDDLKGAWDVLTPFTGFSCGPVNGAGENDVSCFVQGVYYPINSMAVPASNFGNFCGITIFCTYQTLDDYYTRKYDCIDASNGTDRAAWVDSRGPHGAGSDECQQQWALNTYSQSWGTDSATQKPEIILNTNWYSDWGEQDGPADELGFHWSTLDKFMRWVDSPLSDTPGWPRNPTASYDADVYPQVGGVPTPPVANCKDQFALAQHFYIYADFRFSSDQSGRASGAGTGPTTGSTHGWPQWEVVSCPSAATGYFRADYATLSGLVEQVTLYGSPRNDGRILASWGHLKTSATYGWSFLVGTALCTMDPPGCNPYGLIFNFAPTSSNSKWTHETKTRRSAFSYM
jgi:hypothetical protein